MLCERLTNLARLSDRSYVAEAKLDGQRAELHVHEGRAVACFSRRGLDLLEHAGQGFLRWPETIYVRKRPAIRSDVSERTRRIDGIASVLSRSVSLIGW
jgi:hypothetical protein